MAVLTMRVDQLGQAATRQAVRPRRAAAGFAMPAESEAPPDGASAEPGLVRSAPAEAAPALLAAQETGATAAPDEAAQADQADQAATSHGSALLAALSGLQAASFGGDITAARSALAELASTMPAAADPRLGELVRAIAQRAAIELARP
jgi:hypothetical protein